MAKRFTDSEKWKKPWFRKLKPVHKCLWIYILDNCNISGIWDVDFDLAEIFIGEKLDLEEIKKTFQKQYTELKNGSKWFIKDFIQFQYGELRDNNNLHISVINTLKNLGVFEGLMSPSGGDKVKVKEKEKEKVKEKAKEKTSRDEEVKHKYGQFKNVDLKDSELEALKTDYGPEKALFAIEWYSEYKARKPYRVKSDYLAIRKWVFDAIEEEIRKKIKQTGVKTDLPQMRATYEEAVRRYGGRGVEEDARSP